MSVPIAGRRRGQATSSSVASTLSTPPPATITSAEPDWLFGDAAPLPTYSTAYSATVATLEESRMTTPQPDDGDPLSFLNLEPQSSPSPSTAATAYATETTAYISSRGIMNTTSPAFPFDENDKSDGAHFTAPSASTTAAAVASATSPALSAEALQMRDLRAELDILEQQLRASQMAIASMKCGEHPLCKECVEAEAELAALRAKENEGRARKARQDASEAEAQRSAMERSSEEQEAKLQEYRKELESTYQEQVTQELQRVKTQEKRLNDVREEFEAMEDRVVGVNSTTSAHDGAARDLERRLVTLIRSMRSDFSLHVKPLLSRSIHECMAEAAQQRQDIFINDRKRRAATFEAYKAAREEAFCRYQEGRRHAHQQRTDSAFGQLKQSLLKVQHTRAEEAQRRVSAYREKVEASERASRERATAWLKQQEEAAKQRLEEALKAQAIHERQSYEQYNADLKAFRQRIVAEKESLISGHRILRATLGGSTTTDGDDALFPLASMGVSVKDAVRTTVDQLAERIRHVQQLVRTDTHLLASGYASGGTTPFASKRPFAGSSGAVAERERRVLELQRQAQTRVAELQGKWARLKAGVAPIEQCVTNFADRLAAQRTKLVGLHEGAGACRRAWESDIRRRLAGTLISSSGGGSMNEEVGIQLPEDALTTAITELTHRSQVLCERQQQLRRNRETFAENLGMEAGRLSSLHSRFFAAVDASLEAGERLRRTTAESEGQRCAAEMAETDIRLYELQLQRERADAEHLRTAVESTTLYVRELEESMLTSSRYGRETRDREPLRDITQAHSMLSNSSMSDESAKMLNYARSHPKHHRHQEQPCRAHRDQPLKTIVPSNNSHSPLPSVLHQSPGAQSRLSPTSHFAHPNADVGNAAVGSRGTDDWGHSTPLDGKSALSFTDFSTSLVALEEDSVLDDQPLPIDHRGAVADVNRGEGRRPSMYSDGEVPPRVETTGFGRSLTTPSSSNFIYEFDSRLSR